MAIAITVSAVQHHQQQRLQQPAAEAALLPEKFGIRQKDLDLRAKPICGHPRDAMALRARRLGTLTVNLTRVLRRRSSDRTKG